MSEEFRISGKKLRELDEIANGQVKRILKSEVKALFQKAGAKVSGNNVSTLLEFNDTKIQFSMHGSYSLQVRFMFVDDVMKKMAKDLAASVRAEAVQPVTLEA